MGRLKIKESGTWQYAGYGDSGFSGYSGYSGVSGANIYIQPNEPTPIEAGDFWWDTDDTNGSIGESGYSGFSGDNPGSSGYSGFSGYSGLGVSGYSGEGTSGYSGIGTSGYSGISGYSGAIPGGYETGTWTPDFVSLYGTSGAVSGIGTFNINTYSGYYTKIGNQVNLYCWISVSANQSGFSGDRTGKIAITGVPFSKAKYTTTKGGLQSDIDVYSVTFVDTRSLYLSVFGEDPWVDNYLAEGATHLALQYDTAGVSLEAWNSDYLFLIPNNSTGAAQLSLNVQYETDE